MLEARLAAVGETSAQVLGAAALIGRGFDAETLRVVSGRSEDEVASALEELTTRGLIAERDDAYDFGHERLRSIAEDRIGLARRRLLHRRIAEAFKTLHADPSIVAHHLERAGHDRQAAEEYAAAGDRARVLSAGTEAIAHYEAALALGHPDPEAPVRGDRRRADAAGRLRPRARRVRRGRRPERAGRRGPHRAQARHRPRAPRRLAARREPLRRGAPPRRRPGRRRSRTAAGSPGAAATPRAPARSASRRCELAEEAGAARPGGAGEQHPRPARLRPRATSSEASSCPPAWPTRASGSRRSTTSRSTTPNEGELSQAEALLRQALELCTAQGDRHRQAALRNNLADVLHKAGRRDGAMEELKHAATAFAAIGSDGGELYPGVWNLVEW